MNKENTTLELKINTKEVIRSLVDGSFEGELYQALIEAGWIPPENKEVGGA